MNHSFPANLDRINKVLFLLGGLSFSVDHATTNTTRKFIRTAVHKIYRLQIEIYVTRPFRSHMNFKSIVLA